MKTLIDIGQLLKNSWDFYKENFWNYAGIVLIPIVLSFIALFILTLAGVGGILFWKFGAGFIFIFVAIVVYLALVTVGLWGGAALLYAVCYKEEKLDVFESFKKSKYLILPYFWVALLVSVVVFAGFILFVIPGIIFVIWFQFAEYALVKENIRGTKALSKSRELVKGYWWPIAGRLVVLGVIVFVLSFIFGFIPVIGSFLATILLTPFTIIFSYLIYKNLTEIKQPNEIS